MEIRAPRFSVHQNERARDCDLAFQSAMREMMIQAIKAGWREAEAALAIADAAEHYVMYLAEQPKKPFKAANSN